MPDRDPKESRSVLAATLFIGIGWQVYVLFVIHRMAPVLGGLLSGVNAEPPLITRVFLGIYRWLAVVPLASTALALDLLRRQERSSRRTFVVTVICLGGGFALQAWANEAWFMPVLSLFRQIG